VAILEVKRDNMTDINLTGQIAANLVDALTKQQPWYTSTIFGVIIGGLIASGASYFVEIRKEKSEYRKDLADAVRETYSSALTALLKTPILSDPDDTERFLRNLVEITGPVNLFGSEAVRDKYNSIIKNFIELMASNKSDQDKYVYFHNSGKTVIKELIELMKKDIQKNTD
jgi:hypothetical protein